MTCVRREIDRHFEGDISPESERRMRAHLPTCATCNERYERWLLFARLDPAARPAEDRIARGLGLRSGAGRGSERVVRPVRTFAPRFAALATIVAAAAAVLLWIRARPDTTGFTSRGNAAPAAVSRIFVYDVHPGRPAERVAGSVARGDELAFAYENGAAKDRLMIFGVDEHLHVYWFFPAWISPAEDPVAIPIERDSVRHELPEAVRHDFDGEHLVIRALFVDEPLHVRQIEAMVRENASAPLPIAGAVETTVSTAITALP